jgi:hypothetical protein
MGEGVDEETFLTPHAVNGSKESKYLGSVRKWSFLSKCVSPF